MKRGDDRLVLFSGHTVRATELPSLVLQLFDKPPNHHVA